jgi:hypothetical protein
MLDYLFYNSPPLLSIGVFILAGIVASGFVLVVVTRLFGGETRSSHNEITLFTVTNIAVLYTVLLAFIAIAAWEDLSKAADVVESEASLVQNLYYDAGGFDEKALTTELQDHLRRYLHIVVEREWPEQQAGRISDAAAPVLRHTFYVLADFEPKSRGDIIMTQEMLHAVNELYNTRKARLEAAEGHIPNSVWWVILFLGFLIVGFTAFLGVRSLWVHFVMLAGFTTAIVVVLNLIVQLDYPFRGEISVSAAPFEHVLSEMGAAGGVHLPGGAAPQDKKPND